MPKLRAIVALGRIAHDSVLAALDQRAQGRRFRPRRAHEIGRLQLFGSYHCSR